MKNKFLNYAVGPASSISDGGRHGRFVVTAEFVSGFEVISYHESKADADAAIKRYQAADKRRGGRKP